MNEEEYRLQLAQARLAYVERARVEAEQVRGLAARRDEQSKDQLRQIAHRIDGTAGTFGYVSISAIAHELETAIDGDDADAVRRCAERLSAALAAMQADRLD